LLPENKT